MKIESIKKKWEMHQEKMKQVDRLLLVLLAVGLAFILVSLIFFISWKVSQKKIADYLPAEKTLGYLTVDLSSGKGFFNQGDNAYSLLVSEGLGSFANSLSLDTENFLTSFNEEVSFAFMAKDKSLEPVIFFEYSDKDMALKNLMRSTLDEKSEWQKQADEKEIWLNSLNDVYFSFIGNYGILASSEELLAEIKTTYRQNTPSLREKIAQSDFKPYYFPGTEFYLDLKKTESFQDSGSLEKGLFLLGLMFPEVGLSAHSTKGGYLANLWLPSSSSELTVPSSKKDFSKWLKADSLAYYQQGSSLSAEWIQTLETLSEINPAYALILEGLVRSQLKEVFGADLSLRYDIYPLLNGPYAFSVEEKSNLPVFRWIVEYEDMEFTRTKLDKLLRGFSYGLSAFSTQLKTFSLPDGTENRELTLNVNEIQETEEIYQKLSIRCLNLKDSFYGFCFTFDDQYFYLSNSADALKETLDLKSNSVDSLYSDASFRKAGRSLSELGDSFSYVRSSNLNSILEKFEKLKSYQIPQGIKSIITSKFAKEKGLHYEVFFQLN